MHPSAKTSSRRNIIIEYALGDEDLLVEHRIEVAGARVRFRRTREGLRCEVGPVTLLFPVQGARGLANALVAAMEAAP